MLSQLNCYREKLEPFALLALRVAVGVIMAVHGWQKIQNPEPFIGFLTTLGLPAPTLNAYAAMAGEFLGGLGLIVGLLTPIAAFGAASTMAVAITMVHWNNGLLSSNNGFEYPMTLFFVCLYFMFKGAGCLSIDALICKKHCKNELSE